MARTPVQLGSMEVEVIQLVTQAVTETKKVLAEAVRTQEVLVALEGM